MPSSKGATACLRAQGAKHCTPLQPSVFQPTGYAAGYYSLQVGRGARRRPSPVSKGRRPQPQDRARLPLNGPRSRQQPPLKTTSTRCGARPRSQRPPHPRRHLKLKLRRQRFTLVVVRQAHASGGNVSCCGITAAYGMALISWIRKAVGRVRRDWLGGISWEWSVGRQTLSRWNVCSRKNSRRDPGTGICPQRLNFFQMRISRLAKSVHALVRCRESSTQDMQHCNPALCDSMRASSGSPAPPMLLR